MSDLTPSNNSMRLTLRTPTALVVQASIRSLITEDQTGRFGIRPGCEPLVAAVVPSVLTYRDQSKREHFVAVGQGFLVANRKEVQISVRAAVPLPDLEQAENEVNAAAEETRQGAQKVHNAFLALEHHLLASMIREEREK